MSLSDKETFDIDENDIRRVAEVLKRHGKLTVTHEPEPYSNYDRIEVTLEIDGDEILSDSVSYEARDDDMSWV